MNRLLRSGGCGAFGPGDSIGLDRKCRRWIWTAAREVDHLYVADPSFVVSSGSRRVPYSGLWWMRCGWEIIYRTGSAGGKRRKINPRAATDSSEIDMEQVVIVTGASGNLGAATARAFQQRRDQTVLVDRSADRLAKVFPDVGKDHPLVGGIDLTSPEAMERLAGDVVNRFGRIDVLVNTVGAWRGGKTVYEADLDDWEFLFQANLRTTLVACRAVVPRMIQQRFGRIINVASHDAVKGSAGYAAYSASRAR